MDHRKAASVLPEPVGAAIKVDWPRAMASQPCFWGGVGSWKRSLNQRQTSGWNLLPNDFLQPEKIRVETKLRRINRAVERTSVRSLRGLSARASDRNSPLLELFDCSFSGRIALVRQLGRLGDERLDLRLHLLSFLRVRLEAGA